MSASTLIGSPIAAMAPEDAPARLHWLMGERERLYPLFQETWSAIGSRYRKTEAEAWAGAVLALLNANAGPACLIAFWMVSRSTVRGIGIGQLLAAARGATDICRQAGAAAAAAMLNAYPGVEAALSTELAVDGWWHSMGRLSAIAPDCVVPLAPHVARLLSGGLASFDDFIAVGLRTSGRDLVRRRAFFSLEDPLARRFAEQGGFRPVFGEMERELNLFVTALWGRAPRGRAHTLRALTEDANGLMPRRVNIATPLIRIPAYFPDADAVDSHRLFLASVAHAGAHLALGGPPFKVGSLRALQMALIALIEDARIEAIAMRSLPGLRSLWAPYHTACADDLATATGIMARLSRALFDPAYVDDNGVVTKGRRLFADAAGQLDDPAISREIGGGLGNDIGQMRLPFNARTYLVEPAYRDDGFGIWELDEDTASSPEMLELPAEAVRRTEREETGAPPSTEAPPESEPIGRAKPMPPDDVGPIIATYPEWDVAAGKLRLDWTTVRAVRSSHAGHEEIEALLCATEPLRGPFGRMLRSAHVGRARRLKRQVDGQDLDLEAMLEAGIALRSGELPDPRVFRATGNTQRDLATVILIDTSMSTGDQSGTGGSVLDVERLAVAALAEAIAAAGDPFCLLAFASNGREEVRLNSVKSFDAPYDRNAVARLAALRPGFSTRLGAALRHAGAVLDEVRSYRKLIIALSDGQPSDIDIADPKDLTADARHAVLSLRRRGVDGFGVVIGPAPDGAPAIFGLGNTMVVSKISALPSRLGELYFRLARR